MCFEAESDEWLQITKYEMTMTDIADDEYYEASANHTFNCITTPALIKECAPYNINVTAYNEIGTNSTLMKYYPEGKFTILTIVKQADKSTYVVHESYE